MSATFAESTVEEAALSWFGELNYPVLHGPEIAPGELAAERKDFGEAVLPERLHAALQKLNPALPMEALEEAYRKVTVPQHPSLIANNRAFHRMLVDGITVECRRKDESIGAEIVRLIDFDDPEANDWLAVNQFTVIEGQHNRRPDTVVFVNGLPLGAIELKNAADENADIWAAFNQLQTYKQQIPSLFVHNAVLVISDGNEARIGTISADKERFMPWRTIDGEVVAPASMPQLEVLLRGVFDKRRFLDLVRHFIVFEDDGGTSVIKKMAGYHQFHAVRTAIEETIRACAAASGDELKDKSGGYFARPQAGGEVGDKRVGVVWHTQGSGKSLTMAFYAGRLVVHPAMENPTLVVLTDRNDLDDQLFGTFSEMLEASIRKYQNRAIETAAVIEELIALAKQLREAAQRGAGLGLSDDEVAFYDALEVNDSAVKVLGDENLRFIARELLKTIREHVSIDWTAKESVRAKLRVMVKRILRKYGYPPDKQEKATQTVLQQAELLCAAWAE